MPSAAPIPPGPSVLTLATAAELLTRPGCPVCRYVAETGDRYLAWLALEALADPVTITRLCASLGMCPRHTRALMGQPGAAARLTAVYRYLLEAARRNLAEGTAKLAGCPACEHGQAAARRALETLVEGLADAAVQQRYLELGGLCGPHVRAATRVHGHHRAAAWLVRTAAGTVCHPSSLDGLAGGPDHDAGERARLRAALPQGRISPRACPVCLAAAHAELRELAQAAGAAASQPSGAAGTAARRDPCLCAVHLRDAVAMDPSGAPTLLAWQADCLSAELAHSISVAGPWRGALTGWLRASRSASISECPVCRVRAEAVGHALERSRSVVRAMPPGPGQPLLCVRHVLALRAADATAGRPAADVAVLRADGLLQELAEAFRKDTWAHRHESRGPEMTAWRRAAVFLDGGVSGGCPPRER
jgi:AraC-like DNA-binding protein